MSTTVEAVYEQGVLRLMQPIALAEGARVQVIIMTPKPATERESPADILAAIAALPLEADEKGFPGRDHDEILYGKKGAR